MKSGAPVILVGSCLFCSAFFLIVFFTAVYPEIRKNTVYQLTTCHVLSAEVKPYRACSKGSCGCAECSGCQSCSSKMQLHSDRDKYDLDFNGITGQCGDGYYCCRRCCETCRRCSTTCTNDDRRLSESVETFLADIGVGVDDNVDEGDILEDGTINYYADAGDTPEDGEAIPQEIIDDYDEPHGRELGCRRTCRDYRCNCYCCSAVSNERCQISCRVQYETWSTIQFRLRGDGETADDMATGQVVTPIQVRDWGVSQASADDFLSREPHAIESFGNCWYDPEWNGGASISDGELIYADELGYTAGYFVLLGFPSVALIIIFMGCTAYVCMSFTGENHEDEAMFASILIWCGFIIPVVIFIPIATSDSVPESAQHGLGVTAAIFIALCCAIGSAPLASKRVSKGIGACCILTWILGMGIIMPVGIAGGMDVVKVVGVLIALAAGGVLLFFAHAGQNSAPSRLVEYEKKTLHSAVSSPVVEKPVQPKPPSLPLSSGGGTTDDVKAGAPPVPTAVSYPFAAAPAAKQDMGKKLVADMSTSPPRNEFQLIDTYRRLQGLIASGDTRITKRELTSASNRLHKAVPQFWSPVVAMEYGRALAALHKREQGNASAAGPTVL